MMNIKDSITSKSYCLILAETLAKGIFISKPVTELFLCGGIMLPVLFDVLEFFFSVVKIFRGRSSPVISDPYHSGRGPKPFLLSCQHKYRGSLPK